MKNAIRAQGQDGPAIDLTLDDLNEDERRIMQRVEARLKVTLAELAELFEVGGEPAEKASSRARNALRRLVRSKIVGKPEPGVYTKGRKLEKAKDPRARARAMLDTASPLELKSAAVVLAAIEHNGSDTKVAKACGVSRGYAIARIKRLKKAGLLKKSIDWAGDLRAAMAVAEASK